MKFRHIVLATTLASLSIAAYADEWAPYFGIGGGVQYLDQNTSITNLINLVSTPPQQNYPVYFYNHNPGGVLNAYAGLGRFDNKLYTAVELDIYYNPAAYTSSTNFVDYSSVIPVTETQTVSTSIPWRFGISGILGYQVTPKWLPFARLGFDVGHLQSGLLAVDSGPSNIIGPNPTYVDNHFSQNLYGGTIGLGSRYYLVPHFFVSIEGDYTRYLNSDSNQLSWYVNDATGPTVYSNTPYAYHFQTGIFSLIASMGYQF